jgi:hypothetical protein
MTVLRNVQFSCAYQLKLRKYMVHYIWSSSVALSAKMVLFLLVLFSSLSSILCLKQLRGFVVLSCNYMGLDWFMVYCLIFMNNSNDCVKKCTVLFPRVHPWCGVHVLCITTLANQYRDMIQFYELNLLVPFYALSS